MTIRHYRGFSLRYRPVGAATAPFLLVSASIINSAGFAQSTDREARRFAQMKSRADAAVAITSVRKLRVDDWLEQSEVVVENLLLLSDLIRLGGSEFLQIVRG